MNLSTLFRELGILAYFRDILILFRNSETIMKYCVRNIKCHTLMRIHIYFSDLWILLCFWEYNDLLKDSVILKDF